VTIRHFRRPAVRDHIAYAPADLRTQLLGQIEIVDRHLAFCIVTAVNLEIATGNAPNPFRSGTAKIGIFGFHIRATEIHADWSFVEGFTFTHFASDLSETKGNANGTAIGKGVFPWTA
jgi:hypothetical protein